MLSVVSIIHTYRKRLKQEADWKGSEHQQLYAADDTV
jgi:hypothetical protein